MIYCMQSFGLLLFHIDTGIHWHRSIWQSHRLPGYVDDNTRHASTTADTSRLYRRIMGFDATLLEFHPPLAPERFRSLAGTPHPVSILFIPVIIHLLVVDSMWEEDRTSQFSRIKQRPPATDLSGPKASADSLTPRRINLAVADAVDFQFDLFSSVEGPCSTLPSG